MARGKKWQKPLVVLDFDGTLAGIVKEPARARISARDLESLGRLTGKAGIVILTGRPSGFVKRQLGGLGVKVVGLHGNEGMKKTRAVSRLEREAAQLARDIPGMLLESKSASFALHYRKSKLGDEAIKKKLAQFLARAERHAKIIEGRRVLELLPRKARGKNSVLWEIASNNRQQRVIFVGDDLSDLEAIRRASKLPNFRGAIIRSSETRFGSARSIERRSLFRFLNQELADW